MGPGMGTGTVGEGADVGGYNDVPVRGGHVRVRAPDFVCSYVGPDVTYKENVPKWYTKAACK